MSWIRIIDEGEASSPLAKLYERICNPQTGRVDNVLKVHGLHPEGLEAHWALYRAVMRGTKGLRTAEREMIALVVSAKNGCGY